MTLFKLMRKRSAGQNWLIPSNFAVKLSPYWAIVFKHEFLKIGIIFQMVKHRDCVFISDEQVLCKTPSLILAGIKHSKTETRGSVVLDGVKKTFVLDYYTDPDIGSTDSINSSTILEVVNGHLFIEVGNFKLYKNVCKK